MVDNSELLQRIEKLEKQVELLQAEITAIKNIEVSEKAREQIDKMERANKLVTLMESLSGEKLPDAQKNNELEVLHNISQQAEKEVQSSMDAIEEFIDNSADESDFEWQLYQDGVEITGYVGFNKETIIVPEMINHLPVRKIGEKVFLNCKEIHHIVLPETITELGEKAFYGSGLEKINLPNDLKIIPDRAFALSKIKDISFPHSLQRIGDGAFYYCDGLSTINLPGNLKSLGNDCFVVTNISYIIMPPNGVNFGRNIFSSSHNINVAFLGMNDTFSDGIYNESFSSDFRFCFYCLPGSSAQKYAREHNIPIKPLGDFEKDIKEEK